MIKGLFDGGDKRILLCCVTTDLQNTWNPIKKYIIHVELKHIKFDNIPKNTLIIFDDVQVEARGNEEVAKIFTKGRHKILGIIQCEQHTQSTSTLEKNNTNYAVFVPPFNYSSCEYFKEKFFGNMSAESILKLMQEVIFMGFNYVMVDDFGNITINFKKQVFPSNNHKGYIVDIEFLEVDETDKTCNNLNYNNTSNSNEFSEEFIDLMVKLKTNNYRI